MPGRANFLLKSKILLKSNMLKSKNYCIENELSSSTVQCLFVFLRLINDSSYFIFFFSFVHFSDVCLLVCFSYIRSVSLNKTHFNDRKQKNVKKETFMWEKRAHNLCNAFNTKFVETLLNSELKICIEKRWRFWIQDIFLFSEKSSFQTVHNKNFELRVQQKF